MKALFTGRRNRIVGAVAGAALLIVAFTALKGGSSGSRPIYPAVGDKVEVTDSEALGVSYIRDFVIGSDDTMYLAVGKDDDPRAVISISPKGKRSTLVRSGKGGAGIDTSRSIALGRDDLLYVADQEGKAVITRSRAGKVNRIGPYGPTDEAIDTSPGLLDVHRMAVDVTTGDVYLSDDHKIDRLSADGKLTTIAGARRDYLKRLEAAPDTLSVDSAETGPAGTFRFNNLAGIAFVPESGDLYTIDFGRLIKIDRHGTLTVLPENDVILSGALLYDAQRKNLYAGGRNLRSHYSGIARISLTGDILMLSGSSPASSVTDQLATDRRGNAYYFTATTDSIRGLGDLLSEIRVDLKGRRT